MNGKIFGILVMTLFIALSTIGMAYDNSISMVILDGPPTEDFKQDLGTIIITELLKPETNFTNGEYTGHVIDADDTNGDNNLSYCDYVVIEWSKPNTVIREPYIKAHVKNVWVYMEENRWNVEFDVQQKSPKPIEVCFENSRYVDDSNINGPWYGTIENPFRYIQDGIDAANNGDTVCVFPGIYYENLVINKYSLFIKPESCKPWGETDEECIIDGGNSGSVITIISDQVFFYGFRIQNSGKLEEDAGLNVHSDNNTIFGNNIENSQNGIYLHDASNQNSIFENFIKNNVWGVFIWDSSNSNLIYNNNFIENTGFHVKDKCLNVWNAEYPYGGNFWDNYTGIDSDGDGIGDSPYGIQGGSNLDNYPLINPWQNKQPDIPLVNGPKEGKPGENLSYTFSVSDSNEDDLYLEIKWGDGTIEMDSPFWIESDTEICLNHSWTEKGIYQIQVQTTDFYGVKSPWAELEVTMTKTKSYIDVVQMSLQRFFQCFPMFEKILNQIL